MSLADEESHINKCKKKKKKANKNRKGEYKTH